MKKQAAMIAICAALLICVATAGCTASSSSPTASATAHSSTKAATASATVTPTSTPASLSVLFFYKPDCPFCQRLENTTSFQQLQTKVSVQWIVSNQSFRTDQYNVTGVPTLILLSHGTEVGRWVDPADASAINAKVNSLLAAG